MYFKCRQIMRYNEDERISPTTALYTHRDKQQIKEEYNNGWIPCSERLPDVATCYLVTEEVLINSKLQYVVDIRLFGTENEWMCPSNSKIIAWQPLPEFYKERE